MKILNLVIVLFAAPVFALALAPQAGSKSLDSRVCTSVSSTHSLTLQEVADGVQASFEQVGLVNLGKVGNAPAYKYSGKTTTTYVVHGITLTETLANRYPLIDVVVNMIYSRPEFDGEADMAFAYASDYVKGLVCK
jgi:hypothetical protein